MLLKKRDSSKLLTLITKKKHNSVFKYVIINKIIFESLKKHLRVYNFMCKLFEMLFVTFGQTITLSFLSNVSQIVLSLKNVFETFKNITNIYTANLKNVSQLFNFIYNFYKILII